MMASGGWDGHDHPMTSGPDDDFQHFLDISGMTDDMPFDFPGFQDGTNQSMMNRQRDDAQAQAQAQARAQAQALMSDPSSSGLMNQGQSMAQNQQGHMGPGAQMIPTSMPGPDSISNIEAQIQYLQRQKFQQEQKYQQQQQQQQQEQQRQMQEQRQLQEQQRNVFFQNHHRSIPPTPQSLEMPPGSGHFYSQPDHMPADVYDRSYNHQRMKEQQDMAFTPLVSPAVTPLDPQFGMDSAFPIASAYFSPLTSPALHPQIHSPYDHSTQSNNSPAEMDLEATSAAVTSGVDLTKKARKANAAAKTRAKAGIKSSPIHKPQRRKAGPSPAIVSQVLRQVDETDLDTVMMPHLPLPPPSTEGSEENASVSPENLSEMPPPPVPARRSTSKSPYIGPQGGNATTPTQAPSAGPVLGSSAMDLSVDQPHPATPASLMRLPASRSKKSQSGLNEQVSIDNIETLELPESVSKNSIPPIDTSVATQERPQSGESSAKTISFQALPSPSFRRPGTTSATQSPLLQPGSSGPSARKTPLIAPRGPSRKRSTGSVHVSPALLPRISPNIKPLLPGAPGESAEDTASRLLMSKSNYQNILEGNNVPGVSYPTELSTNLTSKRTSHKIAEQGRRNRINSALQVMAGLLPDHKPNAIIEEEEEKKDSKQANAANSKASVVEKAIVHMQHLEKENSGLKQELEDLKKQLEQLKAPL